jgi:hypothetical protein
VSAESAYFAGTLRARLFIKQRLIAQGHLRSSPQADRAFKTIAASSLRFAIRFSSFEFPLAGHPICPR